MASFVDSRLYSLKDYQINLWKGSKQETKYKIGSKDLNVGKEELEQRVNATSMKLKHYENRLEEYI